jgi:outer membrane protein
MNNFIKIFIFLIFLINTNILNANDKIVFIDMDKIMNESKAGKLFIKNLETRHKKNITKFKKIETELKKEETDIVAQKNILQKDEYQKKIRLLRDKANKYRAERRKTKNEITNLRVNAANTLFKEIRPILATYSEKNSISLILPKKNIVIGETQLDITDDILTIVNKDISKIKIK